MTKKTSDLTDDFQAALAEATNGGLSQELEAENAPEHNDVHDADGNVIEDAAGNAVVDGVVIGDPPLDLPPDAFDPVGACNFHPDGCPEGSHVGPSLGEDSQPETGETETTDGAAVENADLQAEFEENYGEPFVFDPKTDYLYVQGFNDAIDKVLTAGLTIYPPELAAIEKFKLPAPADLPPIPSDDPLAY